MNRRKSRWKYFRPCLDIPRGLRLQHAKRYASVPHGTQSNIEKENILVSREPIYGLGQWAARFAPDLLDLWPHEVELLNDDRAGRGLEQMFAALPSELTAPESAASQGAS